MDKIMAALAGDRPPGLYRVPPPIERDALARFCQNYNLQLICLDGEKITTKTEFLQAAAQALQFPDYFGYNWDAFEDCLTDWDRLTGKGAILLYTQPENFAKANPKDWSTLVAILHSTVADWLKGNLSLYVLFVTTSSLLGEVEVL
ncbi:MAG: hypothetical protein OHK0047_26020 [Leptolyngbyaceae cyanobacterium]